MNQQRLNSTTPKRMLRAAVTAHKRHEYGRARTLYEKILEKEPENADAQNLLAVIYHRDGSFDEARRLLNNALASRPKFTRAWLHLGNLLQDTRDYEAALKAFDQVIEIIPDHAIAWLNKGNCLLCINDQEGALYCYERAVAIAPDYALAWANLAKLYLRSDEWEKARDAANRALSGRADYPLVLSMWIGAHRVASDPNTLQEITRELFDHPAANGHELLDGLFTAHHFLDLDKSELMRWQGIAEKAVAAMVSDEQSVAPKRICPQRLGFLSGSFQRHPVGYMALGCIEALASQDVEIYIYATGTREDDFTDRFKKASTSYIDISRIADDEAVERIRSDSLDILIDLAGSTNGGRPRIAAMRVAPLQLKWVGGQYGPTAIPNMDGFITDWVESPEWADSDHKERLLRMPAGYVTYVGDEELEIAPEPPVMTHGYITFGSLNKMSKINHRVIQTWCRILHNVPGSRLLIRNPEMSDPIARERISNEVATRGINPERLIFEGAAPHFEFMATYNRIDIALDTFPYTGGLTALESMWMGVPVVALSGRYFAERHAASHLWNAGHAEWVVTDTEAYVDVACQLAADEEGLERLRRKLRSDVQTSPLADHSRFAQSFMDLLISTWQESFGVLADAAVNGEDSENPDGQLELAVAALNQGDAAGGLRYCLAQMERRGASARALELAADAVAIEGRAGDAIDFLNKALALEPERASSLRRLLVILDELGQEPLAHEVRKRLKRI